MDKNVQHYVNHNQCVQLRLNNECDYLKESNYLSEYLTLLDKKKVLDNLGISELIDLIYDTISQRLNFYATLKFLDDNFVKKIDLYYPEDDEDDDGDFESILPEGFSEFGWKVDDFLSLTSINPVLNRIITAALNEKANLTDLENYINLEYLMNIVSKLQMKLTAGFGIKIENNVISTLLDLNPFIIVDRLPMPPEEINVNKVYLVKDSTDSSTYIQYVYTLNGWKEIGRTKLGINLLGYLTREEANLLYLKKGEGGSGGVTLNQVKLLLNYYVKKSEVYTPDLYGSNSSSGLIDNPDPDPGTGNSSTGNSGNSGTEIQLINIDYAISNTSSNPVANKVIYDALLQKLNVLTSANAGNGISISNGIISCTIDTSIYKFVEVLPITGDPTKLYLLPQEAGSSYYKLYIYNNGWRYLGLLDLSVDLTTYVKKSELQETYMSRLELSNTYLSKSEFSEYIAGGLFENTNLSNYATKEYVLLLLGGLDLETLDKISELQELLNGDPYFNIITTLSSKADIQNVYTKTECDNLFLKKGNYLTSTQFETYYNQLNGKIDSFIIDDTISSVSTHAVLNKIVYNELLKRLLITDADSIYLKKAEFQLELKLKTINNISLLGTGNITITNPVDLTVTNSSDNSVSGRAVYTYVNNILRSKQDILTAGTGISIVDNVISVMLDTNPFIIADTFPTGTDIQQNKLYLIKEPSGYRQYLYDPTLLRFVDKGLLDISIDLSSYSKKSELNDLKDWVEEIFVKKEDIYTPEQGDTLSLGLAEEPTTGGSEESGEGSLTPRTTSYHSSMQDGIKTTVSVGNIEENTDVSELKGRSISSLLDSIFFKETYNDPGYTHLISLSAVLNIVKVGSVMNMPLVRNIWNTNITPESVITTLLLVRYANNTPLVFTQGSIYSQPGTYTFTLNYSYPEGSYMITSNFGNTMERIVPASTGLLTTTVKTTYPWYVNDVEQTKLVPINEPTTETISLTGSPKIAIPGINSTCKIQTNLGLGYMEVSWVKTTENINGIEYSVWEKQDSYLLQVEHKITFTIVL